MIKIKPEYKGINCFYDLTIKITDLLKYDDIFPRWQHDASMPSFSGLYVSVCLFFSYDISKSDAASITKLDTDMVNHESWKSIYSGSKGQRPRSRSTKSIAGVGHNAVVSAGFF